RTGCSGPKVAGKYTVHSTPLEVAAPPRAVAKTNDSAATLTYGGKGNRGLVVPAPRAQTRATGIFMPPPDNTLPPTRAALCVGNERPMANLADRSASFGKSLPKRTPGSRVGTEPKTLQNESETSIFGSNVSC